MNKIYVCIFLVFSSHCLCDDLRRPPVEPGVSKCVIEAKAESAISECVLWKRLENFSYSGTPIGLIQKLHKEVDPRINFRRMSHEQDTTTKIEVKNYTGNILEMLIKAFPEKYSQPAFTIGIGADGGFVIGFSGPIEGTPRAAKRDIIRFISTTKETKVSKATILTQLDIPRVTNPDQDLVLNVTIQNLGPGKITYPNGGFPLMQLSCIRGSDSQFIKMTQKGWLMFGVQSQDPSMPEDLITVESNEEISKSFIFREYFELPLEGEFGLRVRVQPGWIKHDGKVNLGGGVQNTALFTISTAPLLVGELYLPDTIQLYWNKLQTKVTIVCKDLLLVPIPIFKRSHRLLQPSLLMMTQGYKKEIPSGIKL